MNILKLFETHISKSVDFAISIYEVDTIHSWTIRIMCYVKAWKYAIAICSLVLRRGFSI